MHTRLVKADDLIVGNEIVGAFDRTARVTAVSMGTLFVNVRLEGLPKTRYERSQEVQVVDTRKRCPDCDGPLLVTNWREACTLCGYEVAY